MEVRGTTPSSRLGRQQPEGRSVREKRWKRTRSGCLNCRRKRRKCDENKPTCRHCVKSHETCKWGVRISFHDKNTQTMQMPIESGRTPKRFEILDITSEVIRDYHQFIPPEDSSGHGTFIPLAGRRQLDPAEDGGKGAVRPSEENGVGEQQEGLGPDDTNRYFEPNNLINDSSRSDTSYSQEQIPCGPTDQTRLVTDIRDGFTANNQWLRQVLRQDRMSTENSPEDFDSPVYSDLSHSVHGGYCDQPITLPDFNLQDGIFAPGSEYLELHSTLRNHLILEAQSNVPTRRCSPGQPGLDTGLPADHTTGAHVAISKEQEYVLWKNWLDEIAPWLDKFDNQSHFQNTLPAMARTHDHLKYAMLALSARQLERKGATAYKDSSLEYYHHAIHLLLPLIPTRSTAVIASCVVLCVLEMLSCAPKAWRRHLDGCAGLMEAVGMNGFSGGLEQALFWCFARMDVCGGLISSTKTLIPINHWAPGIDLESDVGLFKSATTIDIFANYMVYLCAQVLDVLVPSCSNLGRTGSGLINNHGNQDFSTRWRKLWFHVQDWYLKRPEEMKPVMECSFPSSAFPVILFANPAAISGNQLYHTAALLMLQAKPPALRVEPKPRSAFWHARQVCGISINNNHHGAWSNAIQPLWIAGQWMSHSSEHLEILELLERIEKESGWPTQWRADDLKEFWG